MSESGHSQPGMYGQGRRRRRRRGERESGIPGQNLSGPSRDRDYYPRERRVSFTPPTKCFIKYDVESWYDTLLTYFFSGYKWGSSRTTPPKDSHHTRKTPRRKSMWDFCSVFPPDDSLLFLFNVFNFLLWFYPFVVKASSECLCQWSPCPREADYVNQNKGRRHKMWYSTRGNPSAPWLWAVQDGEGGTTSYTTCLPDPKPWHGCLCLQWCWGPWVCVDSVFSIV